MGEPDIPRVLLSPDDRALQRFARVREEPAKQDGLRFEYAEFSNLDSDPPEPRRWVLEDWLPAGTVVALFGGGGIGKSLLAQQIATAVANGERVFGKVPTMGPVLGFFCEDDNSELRRREVAALSSMGRSAMSTAGIHLEGRAGKPNVLISFGALREPTFLPLFFAIEDEVRRIGATLLILDNVAQVFGGLENDRHQVTGFCNALTGVAQATGACVLLLGHVGKTENSEWSGSTAWEAAVRTRLWLERKADGLLVLHRRKANYAAQDSVTLEWRDGAFREVGRDLDAEPLMVQKAKTVILAALDTFTAQQISTSNSPQARNNLVRLAEKQGLLNGIKLAIAERALAALVAEGILLPHAELPWRKQDRHPALGLRRT